MSDAEGHSTLLMAFLFFFFFQAEDGIRDHCVTGVQTCALPICSPGSIGACATPSRVFKGMRMAGQHGNVRVTVLNLEVVQVDPARGLLLVKGAVPGPTGGLVMIRSAVKAPAKAGGAA